MPECSTPWLSPYHSGAHSAESTMTAYVSLVRYGSKVSGSSYRPLMTVPPFTMVPPAVLLGDDGPQAANIIVIRTSAPTPTDQKLRFLSILVFTSSRMRSSCAGVDITSAIPYDSASPPAGLPTMPTCSVIRHRVCTSHTRARIHPICDRTVRGFPPWLPGERNTLGALCLCRHSRNSARSRAWHFPREGVESRCAGDLPQCSLVVLSPRRPHSRRRSRRHEPAPARSDSRCQLPAPPPSPHRSCRTLAPAPAPHACPPS